MVVILSSMEKPFLVTGASGFVGSEIVRQLRAKGIPTRVLVRNGAQSAALSNLGAEPILGDLEDSDSLTRAVRNTCGIYHIAGLFRQAKFPDSKYFSVNAEGTRRLLDAAVKEGVPRFIHCSTVGVHGNVENPPADENAPFNTGDVYQESKLEGEKIARDYFSSGKIRGVVIRPAMVYGPGDVRTLKLFQMIAKRRFFFVGNGAAYVHFIDVRDLARAFQLAMDATSISNEVYIISGKEPLPLKVFVSLVAVNLDVPPPSLSLPVRPMQILGDVCEAICTKIGVEPPIFRRRVDFFTKSRHFTSAKAREQLGFMPEKELQEELLDIINSYRNLGLLPSGHQISSSSLSSAPSRMIRDLDGLIRAWDGGGEKRYGWKREQAIGNVSHSLLRTEFPEPLDKINRRLIDEKRWAGILRHTRKDGSIVYVKSRWELMNFANSDEPKVIEINQESVDPTNGKRSVASFVLGNMASYQPITESLIFAV